MRSWILAALLIPAVSCWSAQYYVERLEPRGGQRGTTVDVVFHGYMLNDPKDVIFYQPGIEAIDIQPFVETNKEMKGKFGATGSVKMRFKIAPNCSLGEHALRMRTAKALCECVTFWVGPFPVVDELEKKIGDNDTPDKAQPIPLNVTVHGQILPSEAMDKDCYRVEMKKGQRLSVEIEGVRLATLHRGGEFDLCARILDKSGKELAKNDDNPLHIYDPVLSMIVPDDGSYVVEIAQQTYYAPSSSYYNAHIGTFERPMIVYPLGGQIGEKLNVHVLGDALDKTQTVELPKLAGDFDFFAGKEGETPPSANVLRVSNFPNVMEVEPNDTAATATPVPSLPVALNGIIDKPGDLDHFQFHAEKGTNWRVRVFAQALGSQLDSRIAIRNAKTNGLELDKDDSSMLERDKMTASGRWRTPELLDPSAIFSPKVSGDFVLSIEDTRGQGGPDFAYRIEIEAVRDHVITQIAQTQTYQYQYFMRLDFPQGERFTRNIALSGTQGTVIKGEYELEAVGLPKGVTMIAPHFTKEMLTLPVQFSVEPNVALTGGLMELRAHPVDKTVQCESGSQQGLTFADRRGGYAWHYLFLDKIAFAVTQAPPFSIEAKLPNVGLVQNGELSVEVHVQRKGDFKGPVEIQTDWLPNGVSRESTVTIPATADMGKLTLAANSKATPGTFKIAVIASTTEGDRESATGNVRVSSEFVELRVSEPYLSVTIPRASIERGQHGKMVCEIKQIKPFTGEAVCALKRLPHGVTVVGPLPKITSNDKKVTFEIEAAPEALVGLYKEIFCEVTLVENGQNVRQQSGAGVLRIDPTRGVKAAANK